MFLVALPDQDIPHEVSKSTSSANVGAGKDEFDSEEIFSEAQQGEHHAGVPTFLVALPDQDIPDEVTKDTFSDAKDDNLTSEDMNQTTEFNVQECEEVLGFILASVGALIVKQSPRILLVHCNYTHFLIQC